MAMRILYVNAFYPPDVGGGAELTLASLVKAMQSRGHEVHVLATTGGPSPIEESVSGIPVTRVPLRNFYWHRSDDRKSPVMRLLWHARDIHNAPMGRSVSSMIRSFRPDVVSLHNLAGFSAAAWQAVDEADAPAVQVLHDYYHVCARSQMFREGRNCEDQCGRCRVFRPGRGAASGQVKAVVGVSRAVLDTHLRHGLFTQVPVRRVVHNARQVVPLPDAGARHPKARVFGFIGTVAEWKGVRQLLDAFVAVRSGSPAGKGLRLLVGGTGDAAYVASLRDRYGGSGVEFLGRVEPRSFFEQVDVSIVPSIWHDPLPGVVFESMLFGVPVIGARRGGIPEMVNDGVDGLLYEPDAPGALQACLHRFAVEDGLLPRMAGEARKGSGRFASVGRMASEHEAVYVDMLKTSRETP
jgi:glycosyltransferase involved in cell wall biosynthesis